jgi:hypothetical protein
MHDAIANQGITQLLPPSWTASSLWDSLLSHTPPTGITPLPAEPLGPSLPGANIEFGAVEVFSGYSAMGDYKISFSGLDSNSAWSDPAPYRKFQIRTLQKAKSAYVAVGLRTLWTTINHLNRLVGDPPITGPNFGDWSFRALARTAQVVAPDGSISLKTLASFLKNTRPLDTPVVVGEFQMFFQQLLNPS